MQRLDVKVCVCTQCIMNGAMDIVESIENLQKLKNQLRFHMTIRVLANECLCVKSDNEVAPLVIINGLRIEKATSDRVTEKVISVISVANTNH